MKRLWIHWLISGLIIGSSAADDPIQDAGKCVDSGLIGPKLFSSVCWECIFPVVLAGVPMNVFGTRAATMGDADQDGIVAGIDLHEWFSQTDTGATGASDYLPGTPLDRGHISPLCGCEPTRPDGYWGANLSMWDPHQMIEMTTIPGCSQVLLGAQLPADKLSLGSTAGSTRDNGDHTHFQHYHIFAFPITQMLNLSSGKNRCLSDAPIEMDLVFASEYDPTWNDDELANFALAPEMMVTANPVAVAACAVDAVAANAGLPISKMWWCAGSWGTMSPISGNVSGGDFLTATNLMAARALYKNHRLGLASRVYGADTVCSPKLSYTLPKSQYRLQMLHPKPTADNAHWLGQSELIWGWGKADPLDASPIYLSFRFSDCCIPFKFP